MSKIYSIKILSLNTSRQVKGHNWSRQASGVHLTQEANLVEEVEDSPDFWSGLVQSYNSPVEHRFLIGLDRSANGPLPDCDRKYVSVWTMPPGK